MPRKITQQGRFLAPRDRREVESMRLRARRDQTGRICPCPDCGRERTNIKRHRGSKACRKPRNITSVNASANTITM